MPSPKSEVPIIVQRCVGSINASIVVFFLSIFLLGGRLPNVTLYEAAAGSVVVGTIVGSIFYKPAFALTRIIGNFSSFPFG